MYENAWFLLNAQVDMYVWLLRHLENDYICLQMAGSILQMTVKVGRLFYEFWLQKNSVSVSSIKGAFLIWLHNFGMINANQGMI